MRHVGDEIKTNNLAMIYDIRCHQFDWPAEIGQPLISDFKICWICHLAHLDLINVEEQDFATNTNISKMETTKRGVYKALTH